MSNVWYGMVYSIVEFNVPLDTLYHRSFRRRFYGLHDPTNSVIVLKDEVTVNWATVKWATENWATGKFGNGKFGNHFWWGR